MKIMGKHKDKLSSAPGIQSSDVRNAAPSQAICSTTLAILADVP